MKKVFKIYRNSFLWQEKKKEEPNPKGIWVPERKCKTINVGNKRKVVIDIMVCHAWIHMLWLWSPKSTLTQLMSIQGRFENAPCIAISDRKWNAEPKEKDKRSINLNTYKIMAFFFGFLRSGRWHPNGIRITGVFFPHPESGSGALWCPGMSSTTLWKWAIQRWDLP